VSCIGSCRYILWPFGIFYGSLVYISPFWYLCCTKKSGNLVFRNSVLKFAFSISDCVLPCEKDYYCPQSVIIVQCIVLYP
jgi:hypothetical protein